MQVVLKYQRVLNKKKKLAIPYYYGKWARPKKQIYYQLQRGEEEEKK